MAIVQDAKAVYPSYPGVMVKRKVITIKYTESTDQRADILTKPIGAAGFVRHHRFPVNLPV